MGPDTLTNEYWPWGLQLSVCGVKTGSDQDASPQDLSHVSSSLGPIRWNKCDVSSDTGRVPQDVTGVAERLPTLPCVTHTAKQRLTHTFSGSWAVRSAVLREHAGWPDKGKNGWCVSCDHWWQLGAGRCCMLAGWLASLQLHCYDVSHIRLIRREKAEVGWGLSVRLSEQTHTLPLKCSQMLSFSLSRSLTHPFSVWYIDV